jgi:hypothetical protein
MFFFINSPFFTGGLAIVAIVLFLIVTRKK